MRGEGRKAGAVEGLLSACPSSLGVQQIVPGLRPLPSWEEAHRSLNHTAPHHLHPAAGTQIRAPAPNPAGPFFFFFPGKRIWAKTHSDLQKDPTQRFLTVLCQKRKIARPMKTRHCSKEGHRFSKVSPSRFIESLPKGMKDVLEKSDS